MPSVKSDLEETLAFHLRALGLPPPQRNYRFHLTRRWELDLAYPEKLLAVEVQGGSFGGKVVQCQDCSAKVYRVNKNQRKVYYRETLGHNTGMGYRGNMEKMNAAQLMGWTILSYDGDMIKDWTAANEIVKAFGDTKQNGAYAITGI